jgi:hypothetical protein
VAGAEANSTYQLEAFMDAVSNELIETGFVEGFEHCHYRAPKGMRVDGYWFNDEGALDIFVADFECRRELETLTRTDVDAAFKRVVNFFEAALEGSLEPDITTPEYGLARQIADAGRYCVSELLPHFGAGAQRTLPSFSPTTRSRASAPRTISGTSPVSSASAAPGGIRNPLTSISSSSSHGIDCLPANLGSDSYQSFLIVMPAPILAALYDRYSARLLEQNVRTFLQARAQVNKGIRTTILNEPQMFSPTTMASPRPPRRLRQG